MKHDDIGASNLERSQLTQEEFDNASLADLAKLAGQGDTEPKELTCEEVLKLSEKRFFECVRAGYNKDATAAIIAQHPRNTALPSALARAMNRVFGEWSELKRAALDDVRTSDSNDHQQRVAGFSGASSERADAAAVRPKSLMDDTFGGEDML